MTETNPMMYRVFLTEKKNLANDLDVCFTIYSGCKLAWTHCDGNITPSIENQLSSMGEDFEVRAYSKPIDEHYVIMNHNFSFGAGFPVGIVDLKDREQLPARAYEIAKREALEFTKDLTRKKRHPYIFVDLTSRADRAEAERLAQTIVNVPIVGSCD